VSLTLTKLSNAQADAHLQSGGNFVDAWILRHTPRLVLLDQANKSTLVIQKVTPGGADRF
jgi:hypothetical protein